MSRGRSGGFELLHPLPASASRYASLTRVPRFSDHLLAKWVSVGGSSGEGLQYLPPHVRSSLSSRPQKHVTIGSPRNNNRDSNNGISADASPSAVNPPSQSKPKDWLLFQRIHRNIATAPSESTVQPQDLSSKLRSASHSRPVSSRKIAKRPLTAKYVDLSS